MKKKFLPRSEVQRIENRYRDGQAGILPKIKYSELAKQVGMSEFTLQNLRRQYGFVKKRDFVHREHPAADIREHTRRDDYIVSTPTIKKPTKDEVRKFLFDELGYDIDRRLQSILNCHQHSNF
jgi:hypothetical protein